MSEREQINRRVRACADRALQHPPGSPKFYAAKTEEMFWRNALRFLEDCEVLDTPRRDHAHRL